MMDAKHKLLIRLEPFLVFIILLSCLSMVFGLVLALGFLSMHRSAGVR